LVLTSVRQAKCQYSEAQLLQAEVTKHLEQRYAVAYSLQGYVQENFWTSFCSSSLATNSRAVVGYLFLFPAEPPTAFPADPEAFDFAGAFFALDPLPLVFRSSCTWIPMGVGSKLQISRLQICRDNTGDKQGRKWQSNLSFYHSAGPVSASSHRAQVHLKDKQSSWLDSNTHQCNRN
jgi:hypothetical protein